MIFLLLNEDNTLDPVTNTFSTRGPTAGPADGVFFVLDNLVRTSGLTARAPRLRPGHAPHVDLGASPTLLV